MYTRKYQSTHPDMMPGASNDDLVDRYVIRDLFRENACTLFYTHADRMVVGGVLVADLPIRLPDQTEPASASGRPFLERREMALINVSSHDATVTVDGKDFVVGALDCLYVAMGAKTVTFAGRSARLYLVSCPAHRAHATRLLTLASSNPIRKGEATAANLRTIYQLVIPGTCDSAQLVMGLTILEPGSIWNTVPPHTHDRRSEIYFYFRLNERTDRVFHYMGEPDALRHIVVSNEEAVISPPWSVHMGAGTSAYAFIWAMAGENQDYADMQSIDICQLK